MKHFGLRRKLFIQIGGLAITLVLILLLTNTFFLEPYYMKQTKQQLIDRYLEILDLEIDTENLDLVTLLEIQGKSNMEIVITDSNRNLVYSSIGYMNSNAFNPIFENDNLSELREPPRPRVPDIIKVKQELINENYTFITGTDPMSNTQLLILEGNYKSEFTIELRVTLLSITQTTELFNTFILITGVILFILALFIAMIISKNFTDPIKEISIATNKIKELDFETFVNVTSNDELGTLSNNINQMNKTLKSYFDDLSQANENLQKEIHEKTKLDTKRKELLNSVSHELKTPLSILQGYAEALNMGVVNNKEKMEFYTNVIVDEANKTNQLLSHLLDINQLEFGDITLHKSRIDFDEFMHYLVEKLATHSKSEILIDDSNDKGLIIYADPLRLEQVLTNYIQNAIKYVDDRNEISIRWKKEFEHLKVFVFNTHEAFDSKTMEQLFDSFYKGDSSRDRSKGGYGLGLSIVKAIQEADSNDYGANNLSKGVEFFASFDLYQE